MAGDVHPRVQAYVSELPAGLDSYPTCVQKGSIVRMWMAAARPLRQSTALPDPVRELVERPPLPSSWVPEVHANAVYLAIRDEQFTSDRDFLAYCHRTNQDFFKSPLCRALTVLPSAKSALIAFKLGWKFLRKGTFLAISEQPDETLRIRLTWPPMVTPEVLARAFVTGFDTAIEASRLASKHRVRMIDFHRGGATYDVDWVTTEAPPAMAES